MSETHRICDNLEKSDPTETAAKGWFDPRSRIGQPPDNVTIRPQPFAIAAADKSPITLRIVLHKSRGDIARQGQPSSRRSSRAKALVLVGCVRQIPLL